MHLRLLPVLATVVVPVATASVAVPSLTGDAFAHVHERYLQACASCHGTDWMGGQGGSLVDGKWRRGGEPAEVFRSIKEGWPESGMPAFATLLSDDDISAFVAYLYEANRIHASRQEAKAETPPDGQLTAAGETFRIETVVSGLEMPWALAWLPDGRMLVTERAGPLRLIDADGRLSAPIAGTPAVFAENQGGMMEVAVPPDYERNGWIYLGYSQPRTVAGHRVAFTAVARGRIRDGHWTDHEIVFEAPDRFLTDSEKHWGCRLVFDGEHLFIGIGERGRGANAQDLGHPAGKIHRIHRDGRIPADNPFADRPGAFPSIWAYGIRNPQGLTRDARTGRLWATEHGPRGGDEFNLIERGRNYGWPVVSRGRNYDFSPVAWVASRPDVADPLLDWTPSIGVSGLAYYDAAAFPAWRGSFFAGGLVGERLERVVALADGTATTETVFAGLGRVRDVRTGPDGLIYVVLNHRSKENAGRVVRLQPRPDMQPGRPVVSH